MKIFITMLIAILCSTFIFSQQQPAVPLENAKIIFNGAYIVMSDSPDLVIQNSSAKAITIKNGGGIISEGVNNNVKWNIGNDSGYVVPFVSKDLKPITVSFNGSNAAGSGLIAFSTYSTSPDWKNSNHLPSSISNINRNAKDNSKHVIDRFWKTAPSGYTSNPHLQNLTFSYKETEWNEDSNVITEKNLAAQNWNGTKWLASVGKDNPSSNFVKISSVNTFFAWWTLVDSNFEMDDRVPLYSADKLVAQKIYSFNSLSQNFPNPFNSITTISYSIQQHFLSAKIIVTNKNGNALRTISLSNNKGSANINASTLSSGAYQYSLYVDGKLIDTKQMILTK